jgi:hypothetical protein
MFVKYYKRFRAFYKQFRASTNFRSFRASTNIYIIKYKHRFYVCVTHLLRLYTKAYASHGTNYASELKQVISPPHPLPPYPHFPPVSAQNGRRSLSLSTPALSPCVNTWVSPRGFRAGGGRIERRTGWARASMHSSAETGA